MKMIDNLASLGMGRRVVGGPWPTEQQMLLLEAAIVNGERAINAFRTWKTMVDFEALDHGSLRLMPLLYMKLFQVGLEDPLIEKLKHVYRTTWIRNEIIFRHALWLLDLFARASIPVLVLKGVPLARRYYQDIGLRPMSDVDLLVHPEHALQSIDLMQSEGYTPKPDRPLSKDLISLTKGRGFLHPDRPEVDLHWHLLDARCYAGADESYWQAAEPLTIGSTSARTLCTTDHLLHVITHGLRWNEVSPVRWIADAAAIMTTSHSEIDCDRLVREAEDGKLVLPVRRALTFLRDRFNIHLPYAIYHEMEMTRISLPQRFEYLSAQVPDDERRLLRLLTGFLRFDHGHRGQGVMRRAKGGATYLKFRWKADTVEGLFRAALWRVRREAGTLLRRLRKVVLIVGDAAAKGTNDQL